ncbi:GGDEF domain-containing protein [Chitinibacter tainanensis]|uniref:GGDEF domain-containing protein n=1 Tax=Chitinibacter tainanensis TaxID=230667 RepID=UPI00040E3E39|nr:GGDEF domain-containing protein [Chitinibacter tainanensis]
MSVPVVTPEQLEHLLTEALRWYVPDCARSITLLDEVVQLAQAQQLVEQEAQAQLWRARSFWALGNLPAGHAAIARLETLSRQIKSPRLTAEYEHARARLHFSASEYGPALKSWIASLQQAMHLHAHELYSPACLGIGNVYFSHQQHGEALRWHELALQFAERVDDSELLAECYLHVIADLNQLHEYELVLNLSYRGEAALRQSQHQAWLADWYSYRGQALLAMQRGPEALAYMQQAWQINQQTSYLWSQSHSLINLGEVHLALADYAAAQHHLHLALGKIDQFGSLTMYLRVYGLLAELGQRMDNPKMAWESRRKYHELAIRNAQQLAKDKLNTALERRIRELDTQLMVLQTRQENVMLRQQTTADSELLNTLRHVSMQDPLTGIGNRRLLDQEGPALFQRCLEDSRPLSVLMLDLDYFKQINDTYGHAVGDEVLKISALIMLAGCRGGDLVARYGGEEFILLLPGAPGATAVEVAERIRLRIQQYDWSQVQPGLKVTCSLGVAECLDEVALDDLQQHADQALYQAKHHGRNRVESYT